MEYKVGGYDVSFPHAAYGVQLSYMHKILSSLDRRENALLEAPTGCGKTLSLLCAVLAWQSRWKEDVLLRAMEGSGQSDSAIPMDDDQVKQEQQPDSTEPGRHGKPPRIYYGSRTHSQIAQVVKELKNTSYRPKTAILASREHYCVHPEISKGTGRDQECEKLMQSETGCSYGRNANKLLHKATNKVHDIEDLVASGKRAKACPYFASRTLALEAELVLCPYNYLLDPVIRSAMDIQLQGAIIILDEAHNIEDVARDAAGCDLQLESLLFAYEAFARASATAVTAPHLYIAVEASFQRLVAWLQDRALGPSMRQQGYERFECVWTGRQILAELDSAGLSPADVDRLWATLAEVRSFEDSDKGQQHQRAGGAAGCPTECEEDCGATQQQQQEGEVKAGGMACAVLSRLLTVLHMMYQATADQNSSYRMVIQRSVQRADGGRSRHLTTDQVSVHLRPELQRWDVSLCVWALSPSVAFNDVAVHAHSLILTSGTLAPMNSFSSELGIRFPAVLEAPHVVDVKKQVWAGVLPAGPNGKALTATFKHADTFEFQDSVGQAILETAKVVPQGMLVFFPSYSLMDKLINRWKATDVMRQLKKVKRVVMEPRTKGKEFDSAMKLYLHTIESGGGALLFAVCRGKASEGIDFKDAQARAVVIVGIPFPNIKDTKVGLKKAFNDAGRGKGLLSGDLWYSQQAFRCLNQAIGRCIRHRYDYGAVILLDERFRHHRNQNMLSRWVKGIVKTEPKFHAALDSLQKFYDRITLDPPKNPHAPAASEAGKGSATSLLELPAAPEATVQGTLAQAWGLTTKPAATPAPPGKTGSRSKAAPAPAPARTPQLKKPRPSPAAASAWPAPSSGTMSPFTPRTPHLRAADRSSEGGYSIQPAGNTPFVQMSTPASLPAPHPSGCSDLQKGDWPQSVPQHPQHPLPQPFPSPRAAVAMRSAAREQLDHHGGCYTVHTPACPPGIEHSIDSRHWASPATPSTSHIPWRDQQAPEGSLCTPSEQVTTPQVGRQSEHSVPTPTGSLHAIVEKWAAADMWRFGKFLKDTKESHHRQLSEQEQKEVAANGILDCFEMARERFDSGDASLATMWEEWICPLPCGMRAVLNEEGIQPPLGLVPQTRVTYSLPSLKAIGLASALPLVQEAYRAALMAKGLLTHRQVGAEKRTGGSGRGPWLSMSTLCDETVPEPSVVLLTSRGCAEQNTPSRSAEATAVAGVVSAKRTHQPMRNRTLQRFRGAENRPPAMTGNAAAAPKKTVYYRSKNAAAAESARKGKSLGSYQQVGHDGPVGSHHQQPAAVVSPAAPSSAAAAGASLMGMGGDSDSDFEDTGPRRCRLR